jgi:hypothetical protein
MKKTILLLTFLFPCMAYSQTIVTTVKMPDGRYAKLYSDKTWEYAATQTGTNSSLGYVAPTKKTSTTGTSKLSSYSSGSHICGARTKSGGSCRRRVVNGRYCYQHGG